MHFIIFCLLFVLLSNNKINKINLGVYTTIYYFALKSHLPCNDFMVVIEGRKYDETDDYKFGIIGLA